MSQLPKDYPMSDTPLIERVRQRDWRLTAQRRVIAEVLSGDHVHMTAREVLAAARQRLPEVSNATVYNTLNRLVELGEVLEVSADDGPIRYDPNTTQRHQHLVCVDCDAIFDVIPEREPALEAAQRHGFELLDVEVTFRGRCGDCRGAATDTA